MLKKNKFKRIVVCMIVTAMILTLIPSGFTLRAAELEESRDTGEDVTATPSDADQNAAASSSQNTTTGTEMSAPYVRSAMRFTSKMKLRASSSQYLDGSAPNYYIYNANGTRVRQVYCGDQYAWAPGGEHGTTGVGSINEATAAGYRKILYYGTVLHSYSAASINHTLDYYRYVQGVGSHAAFLLDKGFYDAAMDINDPGSSSANLIYIGSKPTVNKGGTTTGTLSVDADRNGNTVTSDKIRVKGSDNNSFTFTVPDNFTCYVGNRKYTEGKTVTVSAGDSFYFTSEVGNNAGSKTITLTAKNAGYDAYEVTPSDTGFQTLFYLGEPSYYKAALTISWEDTPTDGQFTLVKTGANSGSCYDSSLYKFQGAVYTVYSVESYSDSSLKSSKKIGTFTTDKNGKGEPKLSLGSGVSSEIRDNIKTSSRKFYNVPNGNYFAIKETEAPEGYELDKTIYYEHIAKDGTAAWRAGSDGTSQDVNGKAVTVQAVDTQESGTMTLKKSSGNISVTKDNSEYSMEGVVYKVYWYETKSERDAAKKAGNTGDGVKAAEFTISADGTGTPTYIRKSWDALKISGNKITGLPLGYYLIAESTEASAKPKGYYRTHALKNVDNDPDYEGAFAKDLTEDGANINVTSGENQDNPKSGSAKATKTITNGNTSELKGLTFYLYKVSGNGDTSYNKNTLVATFTHNGSILVPKMESYGKETLGADVSGNTVTNLPYGWYCLVEDAQTAASLGFTTDSTKYLHATASNPTISFTMSDTRTGLLLKKQYQESVYGHIVDDSHKYITIKAPGRQKACRIINLTSDHRFSKENIVRLITGTYIDRDEVKSRLADDMKDFYTHQDNLLKNLAALGIDGSYLQQLEMARLITKRKLTDKQLVDEYVSYLDAADKELNILRKRIKKEYDAKLPAIDEVKETVRLLQYYDAYNQGKTEYQEQYNQVKLLLSDLTDHGYDIPALYKYAVTAEEDLAVINDYKKHIWVEKKICDRITKTYRRVEQNRQQGKNSLR